MPRMSNPEVLIAGAGPVGLFAALALTRRGIRVGIADKGWRAGTHSFALALHPQSLGLLQEAGLLEEVMDQALLVSSIGLYDAKERKAGINVEGLSGPSSSLAVLRQDVFENMLEAALRKLGVEIMWSHEVFGLTPQANHIATRVDKFEKDSVGYAVARTEWVLARTDNYDVPFVIGADGHRSRIRRALKIDYPEVAPAQHYAVFEFRTDADLGREMRIVLGEDTADVLWPLPGGNCRWSFEMPNYREPANRTKDRLLGQGPADFPTLTEGNLRTFIAERAPWFTGSIGDIAWRNVVRFEKRLATSFGMGRMWLAGDAAHLTGPAGVQSMNLGLSEASDLAGTIADILRQGGSLSLLDAYNHKWTAEWRRMLGIDANLHATSAADRWVAQFASRLLPCLPAHGEELERLAGQLSLTIASTAAA